MTDLVRINDEVITSDEFIKLLRLTGRFDSLMDEVVKQKVTVQAARLAGVTADPEAVQAHANEFRRERGLYRAIDMNRFLDAMGLSLEEFEKFVTETILMAEMNARTESEEAVNEYFRLNSPLFDAVDVSHMIVRSQGMASEIVAMLADEPEMFEELAREHSIVESKNNGGHFGRVLRGALQGDIEAKVFQAEVGDILGPFEHPGGVAYELFRINSKTPARLEGETVNEIKRRLSDEWLAARARECRIEPL
jgi:parvulin-like peptidyl-prolyl isomerase